ncbi:hypothetical protein SALBM217S_04935 [Streptomyces griseoloalbus]
MPDTTEQRPYHHGNLRTELLDAAERSLRVHGVDRLSLRDLARDVGVSHAAPRRHFADRRALLAAARSSRASSVWVRSCGPRWTATVEEGRPGSLAGTRSRRPTSGTDDPGAPR